MERDRDAAELALNLAVRHHITGGGNADGVVSAATKFYAFLTGEDQGIGANAAPQ